MRWRPPDLAVLKEHFGPSDPGPRRAGHARLPRIPDLATWLGFGAPRARTRGLARELVGPLGSPVHVDRSGTVRVRVPLRPGGVALAIDHHDGLGTVLLQLAHVRLDAGSPVSSREVVGRIAGASRDPRRRHAAPHVVLQRVRLGEPAAWDAAPSDAPWHPGAIENGVAACRDVRLRAHLDGLPTTLERGWALTLWRVLAPESFTRRGRLDEAPERDLPT